MNKSRAAHKRRPALASMAEFERWVEQDEELASGATLLIPRSAVRVRPEEGQWTDYSGTLELDQTQCRGDPQAPYARPGVYVFEFALTWPTGDLKAEGDEFRRMYRMLRSRHGVEPTVPVD